MSGSYTIPAGVNCISDGAFARCAGLTGVAIPDSVTRIADWTFNSCTSLTNVTFFNQPH